MAGDQDYDESDADATPALGAFQSSGRLKRDLDVIMMLTADEDPPLLRVRAKSNINIMYCYGDASGSGSNLCIDFGEGVHYELGECWESIQDARSNYLELRNFVNATVRSAQEGRLNGYEVFLYTDYRVGSLMQRHHQEPAI
jgi:hypothetical protein